MDKPVSPPRVRLLIEAPGSPPEFLELDAASAPRILGRGKDCDLVLDFPSISRRHARLRWEGSALWIEDLGSSNGTKLNGRPLKAAALHEGDRIEIGPCRLRLAPGATPALALAGLDPDPQSFHTVSISMVDVLSGQTAPGRLAPQGLGGSALAKIDRLARALMAHMPLWALYDRIVGLVTELLTPDRAALFLLENGELTLRAAHGAGEGGEIMVSRGIARRALEGREAILVHDALQDQRFQSQESVILQHIRSALCVPLWDDEEVIGLLYADKRSEALPFGEDDLRLLSLLSHLAAVKVRETSALEELQRHAQMIEELKRAAEIQQQLLPDETMTCGSLLFAGRNLACLEVGGDYLDVLPCSGERRILGLGDVSGKGMSAALLMASLHANLRAYAETGLALEEMVARLNAAVHRQVGGVRFITLFVVEMDPQDGRLHFVNAGHPPALLQKADGSVESLATGGLLLGVLPAARYEAGETRLDPGDTLLVYSDGVSEAHDARQEEFGETGIRKCLAGCAGLDSLGVVDRLIDAVSDFSRPEPQEDDITVAVVQRR
ncbi:MAG: SpoIIE family protein phosphatase [Candidatus Eisenbacteria bacterium]